MRLMTASSFKGLLAFLLVGGGIGSLVLAMGTGGGGGTEPPPPASTPMAATMLRVGLGADCLAAAGVSAQATSSAIAAAITKHDTAAVPLEVADASHGSAKPASDALERKIQSGLGTQEDVAAYQAASAQLTAATAARQAALDEIFVFGVAGLPAEQRATLTTIRANASWKLPVQYLATNRPEKDWVTLRDYLDARRIYQESGEEVPAQVTAFLATVESDPIVSGAKAALDSSIAVVQSAWNIAVTD